MSAFVSGKRYSTDRATLLARGEYEGGPAWLALDKFTFLFRGHDGRYFAQFRMRAGQNTHWERYWIEPMSELEAIPMYWELPDQVLPFVEAFTPRPT